MGNAAERRLRLVHVCMPVAVPGTQNYEPWIYGTGPGPEQSGELCLTLPNTEFNHPDVTGIEYRHIRSALLHSPARIKVVILDCCFSGRAIEVAIALPLEFSNVTSSTA
jgi:hypothetical protein